MLGPTEVVLPRTHESPWMGHSVSFEAKSTVGPAARRLVDRPPMRNNNAWHPGPAFLGSGRHAVYMNDSDSEHPVVGEGRAGSVRPPLAMSNATLQADALASIFTLPPRVAFPLSTIFESIPIATLLHDGQTIRYANRAAAELLRVGETALLMGQEVDEVLPALHWRPATSHDELLAADGLAAVEAVASANDAALRRHDGTVASVQILKTVIELDGRVYVHVMLQENDEQLRRHQEELAHAGRLSTMGELVASIAHEINQPLYAISNYAGACQNALTDLSESTIDRVARWNEEIATQARRAGEIITRLGDFVRKAPPHRSTLNINNLVIDSLDLLRFEVRRRQVRVGIELASPPPRVLADRVQIQQVIVNLMRNAFDSLEGVELAKRRVAILIESLEECVAVHVEDGGKGLTAEEHAMLFEPFYTTKERGMGMGLAISRSIITTHGGRLWATSNPVAGATFHFELPRQAD